MTLHDKTRNIVLISLTVALMTAAAWFRIPVGPVPISLQTLFVLLSGVTLGPRLGPAAMGTYLVLGLVGLPVFTAGGGPGYLLSPTFGYLLGFPLASFVTGWMFGDSNNEKKAGGARLALALAAGTVVIYLAGIPWLFLNLMLVQGKTLGPGPLLMLGMVPFLPGDLIKLVLALLLAAPLRRAMYARRT